MVFPRPGGPCRCEYCCWPAMVFSLFGMAVSFPAGSRLFERRSARAAGAAVAAAAAEAAVETAAGGDPNPFPSRSFTLLGFRRFFGVRGREKRCQTSKMRFGGPFWTLFDDFLLFFWCSPSSKKVSFTMVLWHEKKFLAENCVNTVFLLGPGQKPIFAIRSTKTP